MSGFRRYKTYCLNYIDLSDGGCLIGCTTSFHPVFPWMSYRTQIEADFNFGSFLELKSKTMNCITLRACNVCYSSLAKFSCYRFRSHCRPPFYWDRVLLRSSNRSTCPYSLQSSFKFSKSNNSIVPCLVNFYIFLYYFNDSAGKPVQ
jgi:hypothetical protein